MNRVRDTLIAARALIEDEKCWTKHVMARDKDGEPCELESCELEDPPVCWCASGAIAHSSRVSLGGVGAMGYLRAALPSWAARNVIDWNDHPDTTHADVLAAFDRAIDLAKEAELRAPLGVWL